MFNENRDIRPKSAKTPQILANQPEIGPNRGCVQTKSVKCSSPYPRLGKCRGGFKNLVFAVENIFNTGTDIFQVKPCHPVTSPSGSSINRGLQ